MTDESRSVAALEIADRMLAEIASVDDVRKVIHFAEQARVYARQSQLGTSAINHATIIKIRAERRLADIVDEGQARGEIADRGRDNQYTVASAVRELAGEAFSPFFPDGGPSTLAQIGVPKERLAEARLLRDSYTDEQLRERQAEANERDEVLSRQRLLAEARSENDRNAAIQKARIAPLFPVFEALAALSAVEASPRDWAASVPSWNRYRVSDHIDGALTWLNELRGIWE